MCPTCVRMGRAVAVTSSILPDTSPAYYATSVSSALPLLSFNRDVCLMNCLG